MKLRRLPFSVAYGEQLSTIPCPNLRPSHRVEKAMWRLTDDVARWDERMHNEYKWNKCSKSSWLVSERLVNQLAGCTEGCGSEPWTVVTVFSLSGASGIEKTAVQLDCIPYVCCSVIRIFSVCVGPLPAPLAYSFFLLLHVTLVNRYRPVRSALLFKSQRWWHWHQIDYC